jgi:cyclopropane-fatty-acyl-phospholipid synthase
MRQGLLSFRSATRPGWWRRLLLDRLQGLRDARLVFEDDVGRVEVGDADAPSARTATVRVHDPRFYRRLAFGGSIAAAEEYMDGGWDCDDLPALIRALVHNRDVLQAVDGGWTRLARPLRALAHLGRRNSRHGSRRNIAAHYDLGNQFFELFLDETMTYSCGVFERPDASLAEAQHAKNDRLCRLLQLNPADHLLEIGTGWGGFAVHAAKHYGCRVTTATISREQYAMARRRVEKSGHGDRIDVQLKDYRDLAGRYDKIASVEMIEAVGHAYYETFFATCRRLLTPDGLLALQAITVADRHYDECRREVDFIKRYIFPGGNLPSVGRLLEAAGRTGDLRLVHLSDLTPHYGETLRRWRRNFRRNRERIARLGYDERFLRLWEFYLCYCEGGFDERFTGNVHLLFSRPQWRRETIPELCAWR